MSSPPRVLAPAIATQQEQQQHGERTTTMTVTAAQEEEEVSLEEPDLEAPPQPADDDAVVTIAAVLLTTSNDNQHDTAIEEGAALVCARQLEADCQHHHEPNGDVDLSPKMASVLQVLAQEEVGTAASSSSSQELASQEPRIAIAVVPPRQQGGCVCPERIRPYIIMVFPLLLLGMVSFIAYSALSSSSGSSSDQDDPASSWDLGSWNNETTNNGWN